MTVCPQCRHTNRPGARFCSRCRAELARPCVRCGQRNRLSARFCLNCQLALNLCPACGTANRLGALFCQSCRTSLSAVLAGPIPPQPPSLSGGDHGKTGKLPPRTLLRGRYLIIQKIAQGGMGAVYKAGDTRFPGKLWAVKEMSESQIQPHERADAIASFRREAQLLAILQHDNLPQVVDVFEENGRQFMVMEFIEGETLRQYLDAHGGKPLPEDRVLEWAAQLCDVLEFLHSQSPPIIYRDLKPDNVMIEQATGRLKLIDFGIVRFFKQGKSKDTMALGTPGYAPPEQFGKEQTDARSDIYALAALLHHLLTGRDPVGKTLFDFPPVRRLAPRVSARVEAALARALQVKMDDRPSNIAEFRQALGLQAGLPRTVPKPKPAPKKPRPRPSRQRLPSPASGVPQLVVSTDQLDFGQVRHGERETRQLEVQSAVALAADVHVDQPWLSVSPDYLPGTRAEVEVEINTTRMPLGRFDRPVPNLVDGFWQRFEPVLRRYWWLMVIGLFIPWLNVVVLAPFAILALLALIQGLIGWTFLHARWLVPAAQRHSAQVEIAARGGSQTVSIQATVVPDPSQEARRWAAVIGLVLIELSALVGLMAVWIGSIS